MNTNRKFFSKIGINYLIYGITALIFQVILANVIGLFDASLLSDYNITVILIAFCNYVLPLPILLFMMKKLNSKKPQKENIGVLKFLKYFCITLTLMWMGNLAGLVITYLLGNAIQTDISNPVQQLINTADFWLNLILVSIIGPIFEEFLFRKLLVDRTIRYGARVSIILSATLFAFFHGNLNQFFYAFLIGGFFAYVYIKTGNILYPMLLHIFVNLMGSVISVFVAGSVSAITQAAYSPSDIAVVASYMLMLLITFLVGVYSLLGFQKSRFYGSKTEIGLANPLKTVFLNYGMILFMAFFIFEIIFQIVR